MTAFCAEGDGGIEPLPRLAADKRPRFGTRRPAYSTLTDANLTGALVTRADFWETTSRGFTKKQLYSTASYQAKDLQRINLANNDLTSWDFSSQNLTDAMFGDCSAALCFGSNLTNANLSGATLSDVFLEGADLTNANLQGAKIQGANLAWAILTDADLTGADLFGSDLRDADGFSPAASSRTQNAILPEREILGLRLLPGQQLAVSRPLGPNTIVVTEEFATEDGATLEVGLDRFCLIGCEMRCSHFTLPVGTMVQLGGTLRIARTSPTGRLNGFDPVIDLFDWPSALSSDNTFSSIELPAGSWDISQLYTSGEIILVKSHEYNEDKVTGDFDVSGQLDVSDLDRLTVAIRSARDFSYDIDANRIVSLEDHRIWVKDLAHTWYGDANLDGECNSTDMVTAFADGGYERGPRTDAVAVPEPCAWALLILGVTSLTVRRRSR